MAPGGATASPVALLAAKSWCGHSEPAAGVLGLAHAHLALSHQALLPVFHLRTLNPYIESTLSSQASDERKMMTARQLAPLAGSYTGSARYCGTSAFAFQGTNAHAIMSVQSPATASQSAMAKTVILPFQRKRHWVASPVHPLLTSFKSNQSQVTFLEANLSTPSAAYLWDHMVAGRALMPGAGSFDLACSAAKLVTNYRGQSTTVLVNATLPAPLLLPQHAVSPGAATVQVSVDRSDGQVRVATASLKQTHLIAYLSQIQLSTAPNGDNSRSSCLPKLQCWEFESQNHSLLFGMLAGSEVSGDLSPAQLDCAFQLGAALTGPGAIGQNVLRVPVGAQAMVMSVPQREKSQQLTATAQIQSLPADGSMLVDFAVRRLCQVSELMAKPLQSGKAAKQSQQESAQDRMLYVMSRPACEPGQLTPLSATQPSMKVKLTGTSMIAVYAKAIASAKTAAAALKPSTQLSFALQTCGALTTGLTAQPAPPCNPSNTLLGLRALVKTLGHECPTILCQTSDTHPAHNGSRSSAIVAISNRSNHAQQAQHASSQQAGVLHTSRLLPLAAASSPVLSGPFQLMPSPRGSLSSLKPVVLPAMTPAAGQVLVEVQAVGINFRDVLNVLGMYPGDPGAPGADCAGVVAAIGAGVTGLVQGKLTVSCKCSPILFSIQCQIGHV